MDATERDFFTWRTAVENWWLCEKITDSRWITLSECVMGRVEDDSRLREQEGSTANRKCFANFAEEVMRGKLRRIDQEVSNQKCGARRQRRYPGFLEKQWDQMGENSRQCNLRRWRLNAEGIEKTFLDRWKTFHVRRQCLGLRFIFTSPGGMNRVCRRFMADEWITERRGEEDWSRWDVDDVCKNAAQ